MQMPKPDPFVLERKADLVARLLEVLPEDAVIHVETENARLRMRRAHRLSLSARGRRPAALHR